MVALTITKMVLPSKPLAVIALKTKHSLIDTVCWRIYLASVNISAIIPIAAAIVVMVTILDIIFISAISRMLNSMVPIMYLGKIGTSTLNSHANFLKIISLQYQYPLIQLGHLPGDKPIKYIIIINELNFTNSTIKGTNIANYISQ